MELNKNNIKRIIFIIFAAAIIFWSALNYKIIISAISIITGIVSSLIPIIRICKEKPIELIRKD